MSKGHLRLVLLAAGSSRRMRGGDKLLEPVGGVPLLRRQALACLQAVAGGEIGAVAVTLAPARPARLAALEGLAITALPVPDAEAGMSASLKAAAHWAEGHALMVVPADMPELTAQDFHKMATAYDGTSLRACDDAGVPGHPVIFPPEALPAFAALSGDEGARAILRAYPPELIPLPGKRATTDLDTPEDWAAWRAEAGV
ncbi:nucleotidyltransferase family protein [Pararhodobacter oceanensis]|uniref:nucleotidyltransferase family protein n=1 Tax=Pararhodobacter oceanensis TaxID=2172121 RepID=UPI003A94C7F4